MSSTNQNPEQADPEAKKGESGTRPQGGGDDAAALTGHALIADYLRQLDGSPGVYRMLDDKGAVLYVGKARNLRARVSNYARKSGHSMRIQRMIAATCSMMFLTTRTEREALLLEQNLIKQLKPRYNVLLRDDKSFPNILVAKSHPYAEIRKHRGAKREKGAYYGPFASGQAVNRTLNQMQRVFMLRSCSDQVFDGRSRPCLLYQIKRCSGPCVGRIELEDYQRSVEDAERFLQGKSTHIQAELATQMQAASEAMEYERAAALRDRIKALTEVQQGQGINPRSVSDADIVALHVEGGQACIQLFVIRGHQSWGNRDFYPRLGEGADMAEIMQAFLTQFYDNKPPPPLILLSTPPEDPDLISAALSERAGRKVTLAVPQRGEKAELVENAHRNARQSLGRRLSERAAQGKLLDALAEAFDLPGPPQRIEIYDNSHIQGSHPVGGMVVAGPEGWIKNQYRKFNIKGTEIAPGDDFAMMREVLTRRFSRLLKEDPDRETAAWPDLLLIDGGAGQVTAVAEVLADLGVADIPMIGVAKGEDRDHGKEEFHRSGRKPMALRMNDPVLYFIQRLRDEAHRWAIGTHRARRAKSLTATPLDDIPGVGTARKRALLAHFGSAKAVGRAGLADLQAVEGISAALAQSIHDHFNTQA